MYTEENARGRFPLRDILLKAIIIIIFLILVIWLITKLTTPDKTNSEASSNYDKIFSENLEKMESAAFKYYTEDKLPKQTGEKKELTLREMINLNLLEAFTDANNEACDVNKSYIRLTKNDEDYTLRINLKCKEKEDYKLLRVGEYDYCDDTICKKDSKKEKKETKEEVKEEVEIIESATDNKENNQLQSNSNTNSRSAASLPTGNTSNSNNSSNTMYEYIKTTGPTFSNWSNWSVWKYNTLNMTAVTCNNTDTSCLREIKLTSVDNVYVGTDKYGNKLYGTVKYYKERTRTLISNASSDIKWSTYNDLNLINQGYSYTGNVR